MYLPSSIFFFCQKAKLSFWYFVHSSGISCRRQFAFLACHSVTVFWKMCLTWNFSWSSTIKNEFLSWQFILCTILQNMIREQLFVSGLYRLVKRKPCRSNVHFLLPGRHLMLSFYGVTKFEFYCSMICCYSFIPLICGISMCQNCYFMGWICRRNVESIPDSAASGPNMIDIF